MLFDNKGIAVKVFERRNDCPGTGVRIGWPVFAATIPVDELDAFPRLVSMLCRRWGISRASVEQALDELPEAQDWVGAIPLEKTGDFLYLKAMRIVAIEKAICTPLPEDTVLRPVWQEIVATEAMEGICPICRGEWGPTNVRGMMERCPVCSGSGAYSGYGFLRKRDLVKPC